MNRFNGTSELHLVHHQKSNQKDINKNGKKVKFCVLGVATKTLHLE